MCDKSFAGRASQILQTAETEVNLKTISSGKLRRYHKISLWRQLADLPTVLKNLRDTFLIGAGFVQSWLFLRRVRPDVVFSKGGFVCVPVGLAARALKIPVVIHDSDTHPGLTSRILSRFAVAIATGAPLEYYNYPKDKTEYVGIPVSDAYHPVSLDDQKLLKQQLGLNETMPLVVITGGGLGAVPLNETALNNAARLNEKAQIVHLTGTGKAAEAVGKTASLKHYYVKEFIDSHEMAKLVRAADLVITRAGMTTLLELAAAAKPVIIVPNPRLTGGHQLSNAAVFDERGAAIVLDEADLVQHPEHFAEAIEWLLRNEQKRKKLAIAIATLATPHAAQKTAALIFAAASRGE